MCQENWCGRKLQGFNQTALNIHANRAATRLHVKHVWVGSRGVFLNWQYVCGKTTQKENKNVVKEKGSRLWRRSSGARWEGGWWSGGQKIVDAELGSAKISFFSDVVGRPLDFYRTNIRIKIASDLTKYIYLQVVTIALIWHSFVQELVVGVDSCWSAF